MKFFFAIFLFAFVINGMTYSQPDHSHIQPGKVMVKFRPDAVPQVERQLKSMSKPTPTLNIGLKSLDRISRQYRATGMKRVFPDAGKYEAKHRKYGLHLWYEITIPEDEDPVTIANAYQSDENLLLSEPRYVIRNLSIKSSSAQLPNDPDFGQQWNYHNTGQSGGEPGVDIRLPDAWAIANALGVKSNPVIVAVVDGGVNYEHVDLNANMWINEAERNGISGKDDDGNGYIDDIYGYNFVNWRGTPIGTIQPEDHATHVAGIIAAVTGNEKGVSGIAGEGYNIQLMNTQILTPTASVSSIVEAFTYAADNGAVISQNSWGYDKPGIYSQSDIEAINYFIAEAGRDEHGNPRPGTPMVGGIVIAASGNDGRDDKWYPSYFDNVLAVGAVNHYGKKAWYTNFGTWIDISAPGGDTEEKTTGGIYSTSYRSTNKNYYEYMQGTSMACPHVSGVAALILSVYGSATFTPDMLRARLLNTTIPLSPYDPDNASKMGTGLLNAAGALDTNTPPNGVNDLVAQKPEKDHAVSVALKWTKPSIEENAGYTGSYVIAYSTDKITEENFGQCPFVSVKSTQLLGQQEQHVLTGLTAATRYYIAIRANSIRGLLSTISNIVTHTTSDNKPPIALQTLPDITLRDVALDRSYYIGNLFFDPDGDILTYRVSSTSDAIAATWISDDMLWISTVVAGEATLTLTADDGNSGTVSSSLKLLVTQNQAPEFAGLLSEVDLIPYTTPLQIDLSEHVSDPENDIISYNYSVSKADIVHITIDGNILTINPRLHGDVTILLTASDPYAAEKTVPINVRIAQKYMPDGINQLLVYPNPTSDLLHYSFILDQDASTMIRIIDVTGSIVHQGQVSRLPSGSHYFNTNISSWSSGIYIIQYLVDGKPVDLKKFIKL